jgi:hypothetical protein
MADAVGFGPTFTVVAIIMALSALLTWAFGIETYSRASRRVPQAPGVST